MNNVQQFASWFSLFHSNKHTAMVTNGIEVRPTQSLHSWQRSDINLSSCANA